MSRPDFFFFLSIALTLLPNLSHIFSPSLMKEGENESRRGRLGGIKRSWGGRGFKSGVTNQMKTYYFLLFLSS